AGNDRGLRPRPITRPDRGVEPDEHDPAEKTEGQPARETRGLGGHVDAEPLGLFGPPRPEDGAVGDAVDEVDDDTREEPTADHTADVDARHLLLLCRGAELTAYNPPRRSRDRCRGGPCSRRTASPRPAPGSPPA